jgi:hypothetical protein
MATRRRAAMTDLQRLSSVFVELADTLVDDFDVVDFLTVLAHRCVELLDASQAGVVLADGNGTLRAIASSHETARLLELFEIQNQEGPCLDCYRTGEQLVNQSLLGADGTWPLFAPRAREDQFVVVHALPMRLHGTTVGAVNVFAETDDRLGQPEIDVAQALADVATIGLVQERTIRVGRVLSEQLQAALNSRVVIEQAKGVLAERRKVEMDAAFELLRSYARSSHQLLSNVAHSVVSGDLAAFDLDTQ